MIACGIAALLQVMAPMPARAADVKLEARIAPPPPLRFAGPPDVVDPADPLGAFEGRKGGLLCMGGT